jgi:hypothetical protein
MGARRARHFVPLSFAFYAGKTLRRIVRLPSKMRRRARLGKEHETDVPPASPPDAP